jgi:hypothetical protein
MCPVCIASTAVMVTRSRIYGRKAPPSGGARQRRNDVPAHRRARGIQSFGQRENYDRHSEKMARASGNCLAVPNSVALKVRDLHSIMSSELRAQAQFEPGKRRMHSFAGWKRTGCGRTFDLLQRRTDRRGRLFAKAFPPSGSTETAVVAICCIRPANAATAGRLSFSLTSRTNSTSGNLGILSLLSRMRRPGRIDCKASGVTASPAIAAARTPATLELVETMRHCFWLPARARIAASRYGHGSGKNASGKTLGISIPGENAHTRGSLHSRRPSDRPLQRPPTARSSSSVLTISNRLGPRPISSSISTSGHSLLMRCNTFGNQLSVRSSLAPTRILPAWRAPERHRRASSLRRRIVRAYPRSVSPAGVSWTDRVLRTKSGCPVSASKRCICALTVDWVELSTLAAFVNPPLSATATKLRSNSVSNIGGTHSQFRLIGKGV